MAGLYAVGREDVSYPAESPEAALQGYLHAWDASDTESAYGFLSEGARTRVPESEFREANRWSDDVPVRVWIDDVSGVDERVTLAVTIESTDRTLLRTERHREEMRIAMVREDGVWKIDTPLVGYYPW
jgi:hypothetical protein